MSKRYALDASALLCLLFDEPGAGRVEAVLHGTIISAANYAEVIGKLIDKGHSAEEVVADLAELDLDVVPLDRAQSEVMGRLLQATRHAGLSLGDCACLALAGTSGRIALTTQRTWEELDKVAGVTLEFVR